ncbi:MAG: SCO family protein [Pirellula sp.]
MHSSILSAIRTILATVFSLSGFAFACGSGDTLPERLNGVSIDENLDVEIPLTVQFMDDRGGQTSFGELLKDGKPILLTLNYSDCPGLCVAQLNGLVKGINDVGSIHLGKDFKMVSLSINPRESRERAAATKSRYSQDLANHHKPEGWNFLVGTEQDILKIAKTVGFNYTYDAKHDRYNHASVAILISPKGHVTRYLYEIGFTGDTLKMALIEAGQGVIGSTLDAFVLMCYHYDANENRYSANAKTILSIVAGLFVTIGLVALLPFWFSRKRSAALISIPQV